MKITSAYFVKGIRGTDDILYNGVPQFAFVGRSNVGKSSVINALTNNENLVKTGKKPGKTKEINFFKINKAFFFVDMPGYGYAKVDPKEKEKIRKLLVWYLTYSDVKPQAIVLILDVRAGLTDFDRETIAMFREQGHHFVIVANKIDKLNQKELSHQLEHIARESGAAVIPFSAKEHTGVDALLERLLGDSR